MRRVSLAVVFVLAVAGCVVAWLARREPDALATSKAFLSAFRRQQWARIFGLMSEQERMKGQWVEGRFVALLSGIASGDQHLSRCTFELEAKPQRQEYVQSFLLTCGCAKDRRPGVAWPPTWLLQVIHGEDGWHAQLDTFPLFVNRLRGGSRFERLNRLADAMEGAEVPELVDFRSGARITAESLRAVASGEGSTASAWQSGSS